VTASAASIQPELWVDGPEAIAFYREAFGAHVLHLVEGPGEADVVAQLAIGDAAFWVSSAAAEMGRFSPRAIGGSTARMLLVVADPEAVVERACAAGAALGSAVGDEHGWRLGRIVDPFGHEWEVGRPLGAWPPAP